MNVLIQIFRAIWHHAREDWPAALAVTAIVTIVHMNLGWFDAIDRFAYVVLGHISSRNVKEAPQTVRVVIDEKTQVEGYLNRSPLDRCMLEKHFALVYSAGPRLVVVDIDLSPALWIEQAAPTESANQAPLTEAGSQKGCQDRLYKLIQENGSKTVLILPFALPPLELAMLTQQLQAQKEWMKKMKHALVEFGDSELPVERGIVYETLASPDSLSRVALCRAGKINQEKRDAGLDGSVNKKLLGACQPQKAKEKEKSIFLDFQQRIKLVELSKPEAASVDAMHPYVYDKVVFFGAHYGQQDRFLTLREEMYGVDLHALGFASGVNGQGINMLKEHWDHLLKFVIDLFVAFIFGTLITYFWRRYFELHADLSRSRQERAYVEVISLGLCFLLLLFGCLWVSQRLLMSFGIWLSPTPIAVGMLIESFSVSSLKEALRKPGSRNQGKSFKNFFLYEWRDELKCFDPSAGLWILLRRLMWTIVIGYALWLILIKEH